jgi:hypothetical protein
MTKAELQVLIDTIDTTGNQGTTGQELKNIFEALKEEMFDYIEVEIPFNEVRNLDVAPKVLIPSTINENEFLIFKGILKINQVGTHFTEGNIRLYDGNFERGMIIDKSFPTLNNAVVYFSSENYNKENVLMDTTTKLVLNPQINAKSLNMFTLDYLGPGDGNMKAFIWYKYVELI